MTRPRWEYAQVSFTNDVRKISRNDDEWKSLPAETRQEYEANEWDVFYWIDWTWWIVLPGHTSDPVKRHGWSTFETKIETFALDILNELGVEGWEVVSHTVVASGAGANRGRERASFPIEATYLLKRQLVAAGPSA